MFALWAVIGFVLSAEVYFNVRVTKPDISFYEVAAAQYTRAVFWALLAPLVLALRVRVPLRRGHWIGGVSFHAALSFLIMGTYYLGRLIFLMIQGGETFEGFWERAHRSFFGRNFIDVGFYWVVLTVGYMTELQQRFKNEEIKAAQLESRLMETELKALKQQLQPHFLFNTMNTIAVLVREGNNDQAVTLIARLSSLLRMSLDSSRVHEVTLRQEMEFLERYLDIQKMRFADRLSVKIAIEPAAWEARIPNLLLQPIVENAILHGVAPKNAPGTVEIAGSVREGKLQLEVRDDGAGFQTNDGRRVREGIGLSNTRERLNLIYGANCQLVLKSEHGRGTSVTIVLPCRL